MPASMHVVCAPTCICACALCCGCHSPWREQQACRPRPWVDPVSPCFWGPQESLGGNAKTTLLVNVASVMEHVEETLQSLQFASRAMCVKNKPVVRKGRCVCTNVSVCVSVLFVRVR